MILLSASCNVAYAVAHVPSRCEPQMGFAWFLLSLVGIEGVAEWCENDQRASLWTPGQFVERQVLQHQLAT